MSISFEELKVRTRAEIPAKFNMLVDAARALSARRGVGVRLHETPGGTIVSVDSGLATAVFTHPFQVTKTGDGVQVRFGVVDGIEPTIGGKPISGGADSEAPVLDMDFSDGRQYVVLEVPLDKDLKLIDGRGIAVAAVKALKSDYDSGSEEYVARHPICMIETKAGVSRLFQIEYFNLARTSRRKESGTVQHFFYAQ
ncbi:MAG: hypothetical protein WCO60_18350 [Verrucomicrobiota bacterium]